MLNNISSFHPISRPFLSMVFAHRLQFRLLGGPVAPRRLLLTRCQRRVPSGIAKFSSRSGGEKLGSALGRAGSSKSLIEDEAELSDWVSGLSSNSFKKTMVYSDSENERDDTEGRGFRSREKPGNRRRERESDMDFDSSSRGGGRRRTSSDLEFPSRRGDGERFSGRRNNESDSKASFGGRDRGGKFGGRSGEKRESSSQFSSRGSKERMETNNRFSSRGKERMESNSRFSGRGSEGRIDKRESSSRFSGRGSEGRIDKRESSSPFSSRGREGRIEKRGSGRAPEMQSRSGRGRGRDEATLRMKTEGSALGRRGFAVTDDEEMEETEEERQGYKSFKELLDSDEVDDDDDDDEEEGEESGGANGLFEEESVLRQSPSSPGKSDSYLSESRFDQCAISPATLKAIKDAGYEKMTLVQEATLPIILKGKDVLAKARTGTGKTVAFLLPAIELVVKSSPIDRDQKRPPIYVLVICPTRELATQASTEAGKLLKYHPSIGVQVVIGGTRLALEQKRMQANPCQILVATPGRLRDHIENTPGFATRLMGIKILVLDEADHLLDMGFRKEIERIIAAVPKQRQTLLFSATIPPEVRQICHVALKRDHEYVNTVEEGSEDTHSQVKQMHLVAPLDRQFPLLYALLKEHIADDVNFKILVFCTTAMVTRLVAELLNELNLNVREIHSRKPQSYRTRVSDEFRKSKGLILVTSDVSARGVDYPDVTLVVQIGVPADKQQYIHRLGRTGRKGKEGQGILLLAPWEEFFLSTVKDLPISKAAEPLVDPDTRKKVERALSHVEMKNKEAAYQAWLGYYNSNKQIGRDKYRLVELANEFSRSMGIDNPPAISKLVLGKMGLKNIPGLRSK